MVKTLLLSSRSQDLIQQYRALTAGKDGILPEGSSINEEALVQWLYEDIDVPEHQSKKGRQEFDFIRAALHAELLRDLLAAIDESNNSLDPDEEAASSSAKMKFILLAASGTILSACEGFDSISTLMSVFALPSVVTLLTGLAFSALSVMVFYGFNLVQVSKNLGVKLRDAPQLLDLYLTQLKEIKAIRKKINAYNLAELSTEELAHLEKIMLMLQQRFQSLVESSEQFDLALNSTGMQIAKHLFVGVAGLLFFGGGFFAGQSVAVFMLSLAMTGVTAASLPVTIFAVTVGLAAFSLYWYVERVGLQQLISGWFGLDEEKIEQLCTQDKLDVEAQKLANLKEKVHGTALLMQQMQTLEERMENIKQPDARRVVTQDASTQVDLEPAIPTARSGKTSANIYAFHRPAPLKLEPFEEKRAVNECSVF